MMNEKGQGIVEYAFLIAFVAIVLIIVLTLFGDELATFFRNFVERL